MAEDMLLTGQEVAARARVGLSTFYRWCRKGIGPRSIRIGGTTRYRTSEVERWLETDHVRNEKR
jgi:excisionase family DNA binding protein